MASRTVVVNNTAGIHCRPSSRIMQKVLEYPDCSFSVKTAKKEIDLSSILELISLGLEKGDEITIHVNGENAEKVCNEIADLFTLNFDFPPRI